ncbi:HAD domain-containing protein [Kitasatospora fiedleri]|uniref:HAD domain-containing protein n=1 Tax=Kitasatospora fiedleri TaxID=2991545 RepID=UPI00249B7457|nr:HAD domain-containing protein [Kitasatospora fiedleri]
MGKPLLYLDVDGVLNPVFPSPDDDFDAHTLLGYSVLLSPRHGDWLRELADRYELVWATTWENAPTLHLVPDLRKQAEVQGATTYSWPLTAPAKALREGPPPYGCGGRHRTGASPPQGGERRGCGAVADAAVSSPS